MLTPLALPLAVVGAMFLLQIAFWLAWRLCLRCLRQDLAFLRFLCLPLTWLIGFFLRSEDGSGPASGSADQDALVRHGSELRSEGKLVEAVDLYGRASNSMAFRRDHRFMAEILLDRAMCLEQLGRTDEALRDWEQGEALSREHWSSFLQVRAAYCRGLIERRQNHPDAAITWFERARKAAEHTGAQRIPAVSGMTEALIALYRQQGRPKAAIHLCQTALNEWGWNGNKYKQADMMCELAELYGEEGDLDASLQTLRQIATMARVINYPAALDRVHATMHRYHPDESLLPTGGRILRFPERPAS